MKSLTMDNWLGYNFDKDGWSETKENHSDAFDKFYIDFKKYIKFNLPTHIELISINKGYFYIYGFFKNIKSGLYVYFSISDVRYFQDEWYKSILFRSAKNEKDYTGGMNQYSSLSGLINKVINVTYEKEN